MVNQLLAFNLHQRGKEIAILQRTERGFVGGDQQEDFEAVVEAPALVCVVDGSKKFDGTNILSTQTHEFRIAWIDYDLTDATYWVGFDGRYFKILKAENCCECDEVWALAVTERGVESLEVNTA